MISTKLLGYVCYWSLASVLMGLLGVSLVHAGPCDQHLKPIPDRTGYMQRSGRCEGLYVSPVSAPTLELISLLRGKLEYDLDTDKQLEVTPPKVPPTAPGPLYIRAVARPLKTYYRMDATIALGDRLIWPLLDVLEPLRLDASRIGLYAWLQTDTGKLFVPLRVALQRAAPSVGPIETVIRSTVDVEALLWRVAGNQETVSAWQQAGVNIAAGQPVSLDVPEGPQAILHLEVAAKALHQDIWAKLFLDVWRDQP